MRVIISVFAAAGAIVPLVLMAIGQRALPRCTDYLWPSYILLGATIGREWSISSILIIGISILINIFLYALVGCALGGLFVLLKRVL
jgi:hypothetical protein